MSLLESFLILHLPLVLSGLFKLLVGCSLVGVFVWLCIFWVGFEDNDAKKVAQQSKAYLITLITVTFLLMFVPSRATVLTMVGITAFTSNERAMQLPEKVLELANQELDKLLTKEKNK